MATSGCRRCCSSEEENGNLGLQEARNQRGRKCHLRVVRVTGSERENVRNWDCKEPMWIATVFSDRTGGFFQFPIEFSESNKRPAASS